MAKKKIIFQGHEFKTKKAFQEYVQAMLTQNRPSEIYIDHKLWTFMSELIKLHPWFEEKLANGIEGFKIAIQRIQGKDFSQTFLLTKDKRWEVFSWNKCIGNRVVTNELDTALRFSIEPFVIAYRKAQTKLICAQCKNESGPFHVDHNPSFSAVKKEFLSNQQSVPTKFLDNGERYEFLETDLEFKNSWINFHNTKCTFQILCVPCNILKSNN